MIRIENNRILAKGDDGHPVQLGMLQGVDAQLIADNPGYLRPFINEDGQSYCLVANEWGEKEMVPTYNTPNLVANTPAGSNLGNATLLMREWIELDTVIVKTAQPRLKVVSDLRGNGLQYSIPNGMSKTVLQYQNQSDITPATISIDPREMAAKDQPVYDVTNLPLPVIHKDFSFGMRQLAVARNGPLAVDIAMAELAARRVAEAVEQLTLGVIPTFAYGGGNVYGLTNFPKRITKVLNDPTSSGWTPQKTVADILNMQLLSRQHRHYGPWLMYNSLAWDQYLDGDYQPTATNASNITLRQRIQMIGGIESITTADYLNGYDIVLVQIAQDVMRMVVGMDITTLQWAPTPLETYFKIMCIIVPNPRADFIGNTGIIHGAVPGQTTQPIGAVYAAPGNP